MKRIISMTLVLVSVVLLVFSLVSCGAKFSEEDQALAEEISLSEAADYYRDYFHGKAVGSGSYTDYSTEIKSKDFKNGKYIIVVKLCCKAIGVNPSYPNFSTWVNIDIEYTVRVRNNKATIVNTEYRDIY